MRDNGTKRNENVTFTSDVKFGRLEWWRNLEGYEVLTPSEILPVGLSLDQTPHGALMQDTYDLFPQGDPIVETGREWIVEIHDKSIVGNFEDIRAGSCYQPSAHKSLAQEFASLSGSHESFIAFANKFGLLGERIYLVDIGNGHCVWGESLWHWQYHWESIRILKKMWSDITNSPNNLKLAPYMLEDFQFGNEYKLPNGVKFFNSPLVKKTATRYKNLGQIPDQDLLQIAKFHFQFILSEVMYAHIQPVFQFEPSPRIEVQPVSLCGAIYSHFCHEMLGRPDESKRCSGCGKWFTSARKSQRFCGTTCRMRVHRRKQNSQDMQDGN